MTEEAAFRMGLNPEDVSIAVRECGNSVGRSTWIPGIGSRLPTVVDEAEDDLAVLGELLEYPRLPLPGKEQFPFRVGGNERNDLTAFQRLCEGARTGVFESQVTRSALVVAGVVCRQDRLRGLRHRPAQAGQDPGFHEDLEAIAHAEHGLTRLDEFHEVLAESAPQPGREDGARTNIVAGRETARDHEDVKVVELPLEFRGRIARELLQMDLLR